MRAEVVSLPVTVHPDRGVAVHEARQPGLCVVTLNAQNSRTPPDSYAARQGRVNHLQSSYS
jgi:hypothetical protein